MRRIKNSSDLRKLPQVVGAIHSPGALRRALRLPEGAVDLLELRVDNFADDPAPLLRAAPKLRAPLIVTVRHPAEGGAHDLDFARRAELYAQFLPFATFLDLELRSWAKLAGTVAEARRTGVKLIASAHDFRTTPPAARIAQNIARAAAVGADLGKIAARADSVAALARLLAPLAGKSPVPLSIMGMGRFGRVSRLLFAQAGSILNYGYLDRPNASGQWEATLLKKRLAELAED